MRDTDFLSRWGGEEFLIICQDTDAEEALLFAEKIRGTIAKHYQDQAIKVTVSLGVSHFIYGQDDETSLVKRAHRAVAKAKLMGRNRSALISAQTNAADEELE